MAKVMLKKENFTSKLRDALRAGLSQAGLPVERIALEPIPGTRLHRVTVFSKRFARLRPSERQDIVWRIMGASFSPDEQLRVSSIYTIAPGEFRPSSWRE